MARIEGPVAAAAMESGGTVGCARNAPHPPPHPGCFFTFTRDGSAVTPLTEPMFNPPTAPTAAPVCRGGSASFTFDAVSGSPSGAPITGVVTSNPTLCTVGAGPAFPVTCAAVPATTSVSLTATYGDTTKGDDCFTAAKSVALTVTEEPAVTATIRLSASDAVCPNKNGSVSFQVTTSVDVTAAPAATLMSVLPGGTPAPLAPQPDCKVEKGGDKLWTVDCEGIPVGTYALAVDVTSDLGERAVWGVGAGAGAGLWVVVRAGLVRWQGAADQRVQWRVLASVHGGSLTRCCPPPAPCCVASPQAAPTRSAPTPPTPPS
jgi:hypothetical protein